jgi:hypothetical protein
MFKPRLNGIDQTAEGNLASSERNPGDGFVQERYRRDPCRSLAGGREGRMIQMV